MPDEKNKTSEGDRLTIPDSPVAKKESQPAMPAVTSEEVEESRRKAQELLRITKENKAHTLKSHVMGLARLRRWSNDKGETVGLIDSKTEPIEEKIEIGLLRTGELIQVDDPEALEEKFQKKLDEAAALMDPEMAREVKLVLDRVEAKIGQMREKIGNLELNPNYLLDFKRGGSLRDDITEALDLMLPCADVNVRVLNNSVWVLQQGAAAHFRGHDATQLKRKEMDEHMSKLFGKPVHVKEFEATYKLTDELAQEIHDLVAKDNEPLEIAQRMPALMSSQLNLLHNCISAQCYSLFEDQEYELGDTDAESLSIAIETLNECLLALTLIRKTKKTIPTLV